MQKMFNKWSEFRVHLALVFVLLLLNSQVFASQGPLRVLLTSFDPFGGSPANNTQSIVADIKSQALLLGPNVDVETCNLPVIYDEASEQALRCVRQYHPDVVVSLGESGCEIDIETAASNLDNAPDEADNAGNFRNGSEIVLGGPSRVGFHFPVQAFYCALNQSSTSVKVSVDPGAFVCNNTAYHLGGELAGEHIPFTFIHVPNSKCPGGGDPLSNAQTIAHLLKEGIARIRLAGYPNAMPSNQDEALSFLNELNHQNVSSCEKRFAQRLVSLYR